MARFGDDATRTTLAVMFTAGLGVASLWVIQPFAAAIVWAATLVIATWPAMIRVQRTLGGRRWAAVTVMTLALLVCVLAPFWLAVEIVIANAGRAIGFIHGMDSFRLPPPPHWLAGLPLVGATAADAWTSAGMLKLHDIAPDVTPYLGRAARVVVATLGGLGVAFVQFLMTVVIAAIMFAHGENAAALARQFGCRLGGARGEAAVRLVAQAVRGVALGVVATALIEAALAWLALGAARIPLAPGLAAATFFACVVQVGPGIVMIPATIWLYWSGQTAWGTVLVAATVVAIVIDNTLRPVLMKRGAHLPLPLVLAGVLGGVSAFGLVGIFVGPTVLAVTYTLLKAWMDDAPAAAAERERVLAE